MKSFSLAILILLSLVFCTSANADEAENDFSTLDSLIIVATDPGSSDSLKIVTLLEVSRLKGFNGLQKNSDAMADSVFLHARRLAFSTQSVKLFLNTLDDIGVEQRNQAKYHNAIIWHREELAIADSLKLIPEIIKALNNLGVAHRRMDDYKMATDYHMRALALAEKINETKGYVIALNGLGNIQYILGNYDEALRRFRECLRVNQADNEMLGVAINLNNIGNVFFKQNDREKALEYYLLSLEVNREIGSQRGIAICYSDIGNIYKSRGDFGKALNYYLLSLELNEGIGDLHYVAQSFVNVGELFVEHERYKEALPYLQKAVELSKGSDILANLESAYHLMYQVYKNLKQPKNALLYLELANQLSDSIMSDNTMKTVIQMQTLFDRERSENQIALLKHQKAIADLKMKDQRFYNLFLYSGLVVLLLATIVGFFVLRMKTKTNALLKKQKAELEDARFELSEYAARLLKAKEEAEHHNRLKSQFLANMSHEIRTPMNSVIGFADILSKMITDPKQLSYLESIRSSGNNLLMLINDILDLSRIEAGKLNLELTPINLRDLLEEIRQIFFLQLKEKKLLFTIQVDNSLPDRVFLSAVRMRQILFNLVGNAIKFTDSGSVSMIVYAVNSKQTGHIDLHLQVADTGIGIPKEALERIFMAFSQHHNEFAKYQGTGLGLSITQRLVEAMNGTIHVESELKKGSVFKVVLKGVKMEHQARTNDNKGILTKSEGFFLEEVLVITKDQMLRQQILEMMSHLKLQSQTIDELQKLDALPLRPISTCFIFDCEGFSDEEINTVQRFVEQKNMHVILICRMNSKRKISMFYEMRFSMPEQSVLLFRYLEALKDRKVKLHSSSLKEIEIDRNTSNDEMAELIEAWERALNSQFMNDAELFAETLIAKGNQMNNDKLRNLGLKIKQSTESFDVEKVMEQLQNFEPFMTQIRANFARKTQEDEV